MAGVLRGQRTIISVAIVALTAVGCTIQDTKAPALQGPSELSLAFALSAVPDILTQDGASQSQISIQARDANGKPAQSITFRVDILAVDPVTQVTVATDFGALSARTLVTGNDGRAALTYTAPRSIFDGVDTGQVVFIRVTPFGTDFSNSLSRTVQIRLVPQGVLFPGGPTAKFTFSPASPTAGNSVTFDGSTSVAAPTTAIATYAWNFGDGSTGSGVVAFHRFATSGTFTVTLTVTDTSGVAASAQQLVTVAAGPAPTADFVFSPSAPTVNQDIVFNGGTSKPGAGRSIVRYDWTFGSGSAQSGVSVTKSYSVAGAYNVVLTVTDDVGQTATATKSVTVTAAVVTAAFTFSPTTPATTQTVFFNASASSSPSPITNYAWDFGDGATSPTNSLATTSHAFVVAATRTFVVRLTITDSLGRTATTTQSVPVTP